MGKPIQTTSLPAYIPLPPLTPATTSQLAPSPTQNPLDCNQDNCLRGLMVSDELVKPKLTKDQAERGTWFTLLVEPDQDGY